MNNHETKQDVATRPSNLKKHLRNAALLVLGIALAYVITTFLR